MPLNTQPAEKQSHSEHGDLEVFKIFPTIQGEGPFVGQRAIFVRLAGCNLACPLCDTDYTSNRHLCTVDSLIPICQMHGGPGHLIVITGGEPYRQNLKPFIERLLAVGFRVQIETNGTLFQELPYDQITVVCSPKTGSVHRKLLPHIAAYKYVAQIGNIDEDGLPSWALRHPSHPRLARPHEGFTGTVYVQPADEGDTEFNLSNLKAVVSESILRHGYTLGVQLHKIIHME